MHNHAMAPVKTKPRLLCSIVLARSAGTWYMVRGVQPGALLMTPGTVARQS